MNSNSLTVKLWPKNFSLKKAIKPPIASGPKDERAYIIGDVHGCLIELQDLIEAIETDCKSSDATKKIYIIFLGDYIDRGPDSKGVLDYLISFKPSYATPIYLTGNHESIFLKVLDHDAATLPLWFDHGGRDCARSYGVNNLGSMYHDPSSIFFQFDRLVPKAHIAFLQSLKTSWSFGGFLCVHAGIKPGRKIKDQSSKDMLWIRDQFLNSDKVHEKIIVHGHSVSEVPVFKKNRIGIDTGAYKSGVLSCLRIEEAELSVLTN